MPDGEKVCQVEFIETLKYVTFLYGVYGCVRCNGQELVTEWKGH